MEFIARVRRDWFLIIITMVAPAAAVFFSLPVRPIGPMDLEDPPIARFVEVTVDRVQPLPWTVTKSGRVTARFVIGWIGEHALLMKTDPEIPHGPTFQGELHRLSEEPKTWVHQTPALEAVAYDTVLDVSEPDQRTLIVIGAIVFSLGALVAWMWRLRDWYAARRRRHRTAGIGAELDCDVPGRSHPVANPKRMTKKQLVEALFTVPAPRPDTIVYAGMRKLFPTSLMILIGLTVLPVGAAGLGVITAIMVQIPANAIVGKPEPGWLTTTTSLVSLLGAAVGVYLIVRWMVRRRASFVELMRTGTLVPTFELKARRLGLVLSNSGVRTTAWFLGLGAVFDIVAQLFGTRVLGAEIDGQIIEARSLSDPGPVSHMLVHHGARYVALVDGSGAMAPQRVLCRHVADRSRGGPTAGDGGGITRT